MPLVAPAWSLSACRSTYVGSMEIPNRVTRVERKVWSFRFEARTDSFQGDHTAVSLSRVCAFRSNRINWCIRVISLILTARLQTFISSEIGKENTAGSLSIILTYFSRKAPHLPLLSAASRKFAALSVVLQRREPFKKRMAPDVVSPDCPCSLLNFRPHALHM